MAGPQVRMLSDGRRLHLNHGPIDLIIGVNTAARAEAFVRVRSRFESVLEELVSELEMLRKPVGDKPPIGTIAREMWRATTPLTEHFITPMAAVAGAVADEILRSISAVSGLNKAYVNNGGDIAFYLSAGQNVTSAMAGGKIEIHANDPYRGIATSGWRGRSHSLGIADAVSVVAKNAAAADAAATMIANAVDLPGHPAIQRRPAQELFPDSDLGQQLITTGVDHLNAEEINAALTRGACYARSLEQNGLIAGAYLSLNENSRTIGEVFQITTLNTEPLNA
ncbi:MAG: hypothetical protein COB40_08055 [Marinosulfonomonas sp.]|nr:MAG: hypothetical protein COB40_08055 [Marinosulfonomonas sp.]